MSTTTTAPAPAASTARRSRIAVTGAAMWVLLPVAWAVAELEELRFGTLSFVAVAASYWLCLVLPPALLAVGYAALRTSLGERAGRLGRTGVPVAVTGLLAMTVGNGIEVASLSAGGGEVALGHTIFFVGFLVSNVGGVLTGVTVIRRRRDGSSRTAGWLLVRHRPGRDMRVVVPQPGWEDAASGTIPTRPKTKRHGVGDLVSAVGVPSPSPLPSGTFCTESPRVEQGLSVQKVLPSVRPASADCGIGPRVTVNGDCSPVRRSLAALRCQA